MMHNNTIEPLGKNVLVAPFPAESKTPGGIIIPDKAQEKPQQGKVIAVGPGDSKEPMHVKKGDKVVYGKYNGVEFDHDGKSYLFIKASDLYAILK